VSRWVSNWTDDGLWVGKPSRYAYQPPRSTQPSICPGEVYREPASLAGVTARWVYLCRMWGNTVWSHGTWDPV